MASLNALLVAGTDTEVGKTVVASALLAYWQRHRPAQAPAVLKPFQSGVGDRELYQRLFFPQTSLEAITPQYFEAPLAPPLAAALEGRSVDLTLAWRALEASTRQHPWVLVEGLGGLGSPVTYELTVADVAAAWHLPVVLVVPVKLGAIAQAVANVALARQSGIDLRGIVLNCPRPLTTQEIDQWAPAGLIMNLAQTPVLGTLPYLPNPESTEALAAAAAALEIEALTPALGLTPAKSR
ncbi:ATP-dependent dethiobiotin synthetase BioD [Nodosilinea sp. LEGE 06152]|uniref:dethiobiotin synthase n=1 Tax=Nodosilinea sp. LEGE 06152 TaxID=2777966 RepID=UPI00187E3F38|nr:dethiobiotin synthase [Nodosilinea sp. LEGE 06152]MBE9158301.1 ATP-dependent dethiobiotin synthetase BioD [Nodosilinea sp. LEGE 06152]